MDNVLTCMVSDVLGPGVMTKQLIEKINEIFGASTIIALSSYYFSFAVAFDALDLAASDCVVISALAPQIALRALKDKRLEPVIVDVEPESGIIKQSEIEKAMSKNPKAIYLHYSLGLFPDVEAILKLNVPVIEDISHCYGAKKGDTRYGNMGTVAIMSLGPENIITTGSGGLVLSQDKKIGKQLRSIADSIGQDILLSDYNASSGIAQARDIERSIARRMEIYAVYRAACIKSNSKCLTVSPDDATPFFSFPVILNSSMNDVRKYARKHDLDTLPAFLDSILAKNIELEEHFPNAKNLLLRCLLFPLYPRLSNSHVNLVSKVLSTLP